MYKKVVVFLSILGVFAFYTQAVSSVSAASLKLDKSSYSGAVGSTFKVDIIVSPGTDSISGTDAHVVFDPSLLEAQSVTPGSYFPSVNQTLTAGKASIYASVNDPASSKTGDGVIASVTFRVLKNGTGTLQFYCDSSSYNSSKVVKNDINATNVIVCSQNSSATFTAGSGTTDPTPTSNPLATPTPFTQLPNTGTVENISVFAMIGAVLIVVGGVVKFIL